MPSTGSSTFTSPASDTFDSFVKSKLKGLPAAISASDTSKSKILLPSVAMAVVGAELPEAEVLPEAGVLPGESPAKDLSAQTFNLPVLAPIRSIPYPPGDHFWNLQFGPDDSKVMILSYRKSYSIWQAITITWQYWTAFFLVLLALLIAYKGFRRFRFARGLDPNETYCRRRPPTAPRLRYPRIPA